MAHWTWQRVADTFLDFFKGRGHTVVPSSSLIPADDPTLLFVNAGMVQFKDAFLGLETRSYRRAASLQKCMRVQGKHNDLDNVGPSPRHHTFFFMLGNFSFGDYFKREAIEYAWDLVTKHYGLDPDRLYITILNTDDDSHDAWRAVGVPAERILRMGEKTNFWAMGDTGPCGPNSEIHYDRGPEYDTCGRPDCGVALDNDCGRWLEIWNLVFMQFDQHPDGTRTPLPTPGVDTGMGLERIASVLQGVDDDYGTDLFMPIMDRLQVIFGHTDAERDAHRLAYRVMVDHGRAMTFLMADGILPGNEGRGYALRMIMRRAMRFYRSAGGARPFLADLAQAVIAEMGERYPELVTHRGLITSLASAEEERFTQTLTSGLTRVGDLLSDLTARGERVVPGSDVFQLSDTYGFPVEMTRDIARERGLDIDEAGFAAAMEEQRERARAASTFRVGMSSAHQFAMLSDLPATEFVGYRRHAVRATIQAILLNGERVDDAVAGTDVDVVLNHTPFYPEGGGQVGDTGTLTGARVEVAVRDTQRTPGGAVVHVGSIVRGRLAVGQAVRAQIDEPRRWDIMRNHTATHLLHKALQEVLGEHARQAGSLVAPDRLRFDFVHLAPLTPEQRAAVEERVYEQVLADLPVRATWMKQEDALASGAMALFGEKYGEQVRVVTVDDYSRELCGGTHLSRTGQIGLFKIAAEEGVAAGVRRIEAVTGRGAFARVADQEQALRTGAAALKTTPEELAGRVTRLAERVRELERRLESPGTLGEDQRRLVDSAINDSVEVHGVRFVFKAVRTETPGQLRMLSDTVRERLGQIGQPGVVVLASNSTGDVVAARTRDNELVDTNVLIKAVTEELGGRGGGRPEFSQGRLRSPQSAARLEHMGEDEEFVARFVRLA